MRGSSGRADNGYIVGRVFEDARQRPRRLAGNTGKLISAITLAGDSVSFDGRDFGYYLSMVAVPIQRKFVNALIHYFAILAARADANLFVDDDDRLLCQDGRLVYESLRSIGD